MSKIPTTNFTLEIKNAIEKISDTYDSKNYLEKFQYDVKEYIAKSDTRGLLLYHKVGTGKSITSASIAEYYRVHDKNRKIIVLLSKSLQENFKGNIRKYMFNNKESGPSNKDYINDTIEKHYKFISLNSNNMYSTISNINKSSEGQEFEKHLGKLNEYIGGNRSFLENSILIIDEVHNLSISIKNGSKNAIQLYNTIMKTKNIKLVFLSGTPIVNTPFELVPLFNMLKGFIYYNNAKYTLFPESNDEFRNFFVDKETNKIKNKNIFQNRIVGLISYYGDFYSEGIKEGFPDEKPLIIERIPMSQPQFAKYQEARNLEEKEASNKFMSNTKSESFGIKTDSSPSSYRVRTRQLSNYLVPYYAIKYEQDPKTTNKILTKKNIYEITTSDLKELDKFSPKFEAIIKNIKKYPNTLSYVFSEFVNGEGIKLFARVLEARENYVYWHNGPAFNDDENADAGFDLVAAKSPNKRSKTKTSKTYAIISGEVPFIERNNILKTFNSKKNITGDLISLLLISESGAEGLTFKNIRSMHITEPGWNYALIEQLIARGSRFGSHTELPKDKQNIQPYIYISTYPLETNPNDDSLQSRTTDEELLYLSLTGKELRDQFLMALIESSIDCSINRDKLSPELREKFTCHLCIPNDKPLYYPDLNVSIKTNNCSHIEEEEIAVKKIAMNGVNYYYTKTGNNVKVYEFDDSIGHYIDMKKSNPIYSDIVIKVLKF